MIVDLHSHTTASDGLLEPAALLAEAVKAGLDVLAITDHDTVDGVKLALEAASRTSLPLQIVPGIEISCWVGRTEIHVLGLGIDPATPGLELWLKGLIAERVDRVTRIGAALAGHGIRLDLSSLLAGGKPGSIGRPHIARLLIAGGHVRNIDEAFDRWLSPGRPAFVERVRLSAEEAIRWIHQAGGVAVQAHPGAMGVDADIPRLVEWGLDGLEVFHPDHPLPARHRYAHLCDDLGLLATGGSDFHSHEESRPGVHRPGRLGLFGTPERTWESIASRTLARRGQPLPDASP